MTRFKELISEERIRKRVAEVASALDAHYQGREITLVAILKGSICLASDLMRAMKTPCSLEFLRAESYGAAGTLRGELRISGLENLSVASKDLLLVDDIFDTGETLSQIAEALAALQPKSLLSLVLLSKEPVKRKTSYRPDYTLFQIENHFVIGYGLDYKELYRGLPGIYQYTE
ncbi:MAG: hypoxanthine phosphoribosyltransferase [Verrucomicrobia bacterium]|nr:hypoxanthine phosphoribosyltransferase [Verrucomicrobiota bacterium]